MERQPSVLLVEDEHALRGLVASFLRLEQFHVSEAGDGPEGVRRFFTQGPFDLVMVDLNLPGFSGIEVCRRIRQNHPTLPILVASAVILDDARESLESLAVSAFLTKPYLPLELVRLIRRLTGSAHHAGPASLLAAHASNR